MLARLAILFALACPALPAGVAAQATPPVARLVVLSSNGVRAPLEEARSALEAAVGHEIVFEFSTATELTERIRAGAAFDAAVLTPSLLDALDELGMLRAEPRTTIARTGVGIGAREGMRYSETPASPDALRALLLGAASVAFTRDGQSRRTIDAAFERLGIAATMRGKTRLLGPGQAPQAVVAGNAELVLTLVSEIVTVPGLVLVGAFPEELQAYVSFAAAVSRRAADADGAAHFLAALMAPRFAQTLRNHGLEPIHR